jgi:multisubunit Na+/H+ antiporter MnhG subunit
LVAVINTVVSDVLLGVAVVVVLAGSLGVLVMRGVYAKLHFLTPIALVAPVAVAVAVTVRTGFSQNTVQTWLTLGLLVIAGPFLSHATIRAASIREAGDWRGPRGGGNNRSAGGER